MKKYIILLSLILSLTALNSHAAETVYSLRANNPATSSVDIPINLLSDLTSTAINFITLPIEIIVNSLLSAI